MIERRLARMSRRGVWPPFIRIAALGLGPVLVLALLAGCDDGEDADADLRLRTIQLTVTDSGIEPDQVRLRTPDTARVVVENESDESCEFRFGPYVRGFVVEPGDSFSMEFRAFEVDVDLAAEGPLTMGCEDGVREGAIELLQGASGEASQ